MREEVYQVIKSNKKLVGLLLVFCFLLWIIPVLNVLAQGEVPNVGINSMEASVGTILPVPITINNPYDINGFQFDLTYDTSIMEPVMIPNTQDPDIDVPKVEAGDLSGQISTNLISPGLIKISLGGSQSITVSQAILCRVFFLPKCVGNTTIEANNIQLSNSLGQIVPCSTSNNGYITVMANKEALITAINNATTLIESKTVGTEVGNVTQAAKDTFQAAIDEAVKVNNDIAATQAAVDNQVELLSNAAIVLNNAVITGESFALSDLQIIQPTDTEPLKVTVNITRISGSQSAVVVFQLKDSNGAAAGIKTVDIQLPNGSQTISALFPEISGDGYTVKAMVFDKLTNATNDVGYSLAVPLP